ncbi:hypothetical protein AGABI1DRAFT_76352 [Agaricus bisporus var. burnettii JB137-S8]|uniref:Terpene synthase n=1 Tax=Agaricus bisporus var. burnettii (strain JB137-S8 / ATCC MYA-4627 / FGSC 10392) TaxID=597362 RepID=K5X492_AGABU|nr:uncharacterized protein AGABI1DRAFT_76352 [Agaricus bisporus var. burnettii JB137-S8]EKM77998.1 hypothetical protein AGABI1DRAFT_76352 [Agaricus bisporus var. burnettii JB137-S8]
MVFSPSSFSKRNDTPDHFILPDLVGHCSYTVRLNPNCDRMARQSEKWLLKLAKHPRAKQIKFLGLKAGELTAACYPDTDGFRLRVCDDFMNYLFNLDDWLDDFDVNDTYGMRNCCIGVMQDPQSFQTKKRAGRLTKHFFKRFAKGAGPGCRERFIHSMDLFFTAVATQSRDRADGITPDLESYITVRRDTSGCKPCFQLIEFAGDFDLPDEVVNHELIQNLEEATNDLVTWSNDIFSYNKEQKYHDTHNMITVVMNQYGFTLQQAVDFVGFKCKKSIENFEYDRNRLPSWGIEIDRMVEKYVDGLQNWIVGSLHWSFDTERYFSKDGHQIKKHRLVKLSPQVPLVVFQA